MLRKHKNAFKIHCEEFSNKWCYFEWHAISEDVTFEAVIFCDLTSINYAINENGTIHASITHSNYKNSSKMAKVWKMSLPNFHLRDVSRKTRTFFGCHETPC